VDGVLLAAYNSNQTQTLRLSWTNPAKEGELVRILSGDSLKDGTDRTRSFQKASSQTASGEKVGSAPHLASFHSLPRCQLSFAPPWSLPQAEGHNIKILKDRNTADVLRLCIQLKSRRARLADFCGEERLQEPPESGSLAWILISPAPSVINARVRGSHRLSKLCNSVHTPSHRFFGG
jgi:hypothetical protein